MARPVNAGNYYVYVLALWCYGAGCAREQTLGPHPSPPGLPCRLCPQAKEDVLPFCMYSEASRMFALPSRADVESRRVVVATCCAAGEPLCSRGGRLRRQGLPRLLRRSGDVGSPRHPYLCSVLCLLRPR